MHFMWVSTSDIKIKCLQYFTEFFLQSSWQYFGKEESMILCLHSSRFWMQKRIEKRLISIGFLKNGRIFLIKGGFFCQICPSNPFRTCVCGENSDKMSLADMFQKVTFMATMQTALPSMEKVAVLKESSRWDDSHGNLTLTLWLCTCKAWDFDEMFRNMPISTVSVPYVLHKHFTVTHRWRVKS